MCHLLLSLSTATPILRLLSTPHRHRQAWFSVNAVVLVTRWQQLLQTCGAQTPAIARGLVTFSPASCLELVLLGIAIAAGVFHLVLRFASRPFHLALQLLLLNFTWSCNLLAGNFTCPCICYNSISLALAIFWQVILLVLAFATTQFHLSLQFAGW